MNPVPTITKNSPLKVEEVQEDYHESPMEKRGKAIFILGIFFSVLILVATWIIFSLWVK